MKQLKSYLKVLIWPIIFMIGQFFIKYLFVALFNSKYYANQDLYGIINTVEYQQKLNNYINNHIVYLILIIGLIFIPILYINYRKYRHIENNYNKEIILYFMIGILIAILYNLYISVIIPYNISSIPIYYQILSSGFIGPIYEELLFRGIVYNKFKQFKSKSKSMFLTTLLFAIMHFSIIDFIYTIVMGYLFIKIYDKTNKLRYSIILHICVNISVILLGLIINMYNIFLNIFLFVILSIILVIVSLRLFTKNIQV